MFEKLLETIKSESVRFLTKVEVSETSTDDNQRGEDLINKTKSKKDSFASLLENKLEPNDNQTNLSTEGNRRQRRIKAKAKRKRR